MKVKSLIVLIFVALLAVFLSGCGPCVKQPVATEAPAPAPVPATVTPAPPPPTPLPPPPPPPPAAPKPKVMVFGEAALFDFDKSDLKPEGKEQILKYRDDVRAEMSSASKIKITGYTDSSGSAEYNKALSLRRAEAVRDYLVTLGADPSKIEVSGEGQSNPVADNSTKEGRAKNRRVEVEIIGLGKS